MDDQRAEKYYRSQENIDLFVQMLFISRLSQKVELSKIAILLEEKLYGRVI